MSEKASSKSTIVKRRRIGPGWGAAFAWLILGFVAAGSAGVVALTDNGAARLALLSSPAANRWAVKEDVTMPQIAELQTEITRLRSEARRASIEKKALSQRLAGLEEQFDPVVTGSLPQAPREMSDPVAVKKEKKPPVRVSYRALPSIGAKDETVRVVPIEQAGSAAEAMPVTPSPRSVDLATTPEASDPALLMKTSFAIEIGSAKTMAELKDRWMRLSERHAPEVEGFDPLVAVRETVSGDLELRLLAGPINNAADAIRLCVRIRDIGTDCTPVSYEGQRLAMH